MDEEDELGVAGGGFDFGGLGRGVEGCAEVGEGGEEVGVVFLEGEQVGGFRVGGWEGWRGGGGGGGGGGIVLSLGGEIGCGGGGIVAFWGL